MSLTTFINALFEHTELRAHNLEQFKNNIRLYDRYQTNKTSMNKNGIGMILGIMIVYNIRSYTLTVFIPYNNYAKMVLLIALYLNSV